VQRDAILVILPGPAIPFRNCRYFQRVRVDLEEGASFVWGDLWLAGRYQRGDASERFRFNIVLQDLAIHRQGRLIYRDRFCWRGPWQETAAGWHFGGWPACASLFITGDGNAIFPSVEGVQAAVFTTAFGDRCIRWHGPPEAASRCLVQAALRSAAKIDNASTSWLLDGHNLGPNHWFSVVDNNALASGQR
jgi:urease accessory protein